MVYLKKNKKSFNNIFSIYIKKYYNYIIYNNFYKYIYGCWIQNTLDVPLHKTYKNKNKNTFE